MKLTLLGNYFLWLTLLMPLGLIAAPNSEKLAKQPTTSLGNQVIQKPNEVRAQTEISAVTVYLDRAQVTRKMTQHFLPGKYTVLFDNLPNSINQNSVQVDGTGAVILNDVKYKTEYYSVVPDERIRKQKAELQNLLDVKTDIDDKISNAKSEKNFVTNISKKLTTVSQKSTHSPQLDPNKWIRMVDFYRKRFASLDKELRLEQRKLRELQKKIDKLTRELAAMGGQRNKSRKQVKAVIIVKRPGPIELRLSYIVMGPAWYPVYDLRVLSNSKEMELTYNAVIRQNTGEDWNDIQVQLSTARPNVGGQPPKMNPWRISLNRVQPIPGFDSASKSAPRELIVEDKKKIFKNFADGLNKPEVASGRKLGDIARGRLPTRAARVATKATSVVFQIKEKYTVKSDNNSHKVTIMNKKFKAKFRYSATPKQSKFAYLKAQVKNDTGYPFISGKTNIFLDNSFVAHAKIKSVAPNETFWTFLGVDEGVKVEYKFIKKHKDKEGVFSKSNKIEYEYLMEITNNKQQKLDLVIWDQLPISNNEKLKVTLLQPRVKDDSKNIKINKTKFVEWKFEPKPGEKIKIPFKFSVEYPADKKFIISDPSFGLIK